MSEEDRQLELSFESRTPMPLDQKSREIIRGDLNANHMVLAGAGAGKTYELVERMVALLVMGPENESVDIRNIAAITFTRKAAGELRTRFYDRLLREAESASGPSSERLKDAAARIDQCFIGTIHAFCSRLLRERPLEAGLPFDFKELDERDEPRARRRAWTDFTNARLREGDRRLQRLLEIGFNAENLYHFFSRRNEFPELELKPTDAAEPELEEAVRQISALVEQSEPLLTPEGRAKPGKWGEAAMKAKTLLEKRDLSTTADHAELLLLFDSKALLDGGVKVTRYTDKSFAYQLRDQLVPALKREIIDPALRSWKQYVYGLMGGLVDEATRYYTEQRRLAGVVTFADLLIKTAHLLRDNPAVRRYFQQRYRRLLVDEFQDTDPVQAEILFYLTGSNVQEKNWKKLDPQPGSLFVVGDEKQSIYRFRRADVETFRFVRDRIEETGGKVVSLNTSFRSLGNLCDWLNDTFQSIFEVEDRAYQSEYGPLLRYRDAGEDPVCVRTLRISDINGGREAIVAAEAERIGDFIAASRAGKTEFNGTEPGSLMPPTPSYGSFMILAWNKKHVEAHAQALEARGIPYDLVGGDLGRSDELEVVTSMLEAVADPNNPIPLIAYLRGLVVGLGDDELFASRKAVKRFDYEPAELAGLSPETGRKLSTAFVRLRRARDLLESLPPAAAFEQIIDDVGLIPWTASSTDFMGSSRAGNLIRLLANVRRWERQGLHWVEMVREMRALIEDSEFQIPGLTLESGQEDAVRIMNLHQAKGLEADVVFLTDPTGLGYTGPPDFHVSRLGDEPYLSMAVQSKKGWGYKTLAEPEGWPDDEAREAKYLEAENTRLRYVAATRARNLLVVTLADGAKKGPWLPLSRSLTYVPELGTYDQARAPALVDTPTVHDEVIERRAQEWEAVREPSWSVATASIEGEDHVLFLSGEQRGADFGSAVHQLFDDLVAGRVDDVDAYLETSTTLDEGGRRAAVDAVHGLRSSNLWREVQRADRVYTEVPFGAVVEPAPITLLRGRIDLVYHIDGGWKIVDYKTDAADTDLEVQHLVNHYRDQIASYAEHWSRITGEHILEKGLWLTAMNRYVPVE